MADWNNILAENEELLSDEELLKYLSHTLSEAQKHETEKKLATSAFDSDAMEGLQKVDDSEQLQRHVKQLNKVLQQQLSARKKRRPKPAVQIFRWVLLAILILLLICIIGFALIKMQ